jgi:hypothetical protein
VKLLKLALVNCLLLLFREISINSFCYLLCIDDDEEEEGGEASEPKSPGAFDYFMHFISLFWKILFAFVPPTG